MAAPQMIGREHEPLIRRLQELLDDTELTAGTVQSIREQAPDERQALVFLLRLGETDPDALRDALRNPARAEDLIFCLGGSELIGGGLPAAGPGWIEVFDRARAGADPVDSPAPEFASAEALGAFKRRKLLGIAIRDLLRRATVVETIGAMSRLADECIAGAVALAGRELPDPAAAAEFCVLAMGKLGAQELNLSSDVDLVYLFDSDDPARLARAQRFAGRVTELIAAQCFRIDLRLRPGGRGAPAVSSINGALSFYESFGQTWERAALLRARLLIDPQGRGRAFLTELARFIYRSYLDFDTVRELRAIKQQIEDELHAPDQLHRNIKLGYGGIRELEFIVQALTLIYGGRDPRLRTAQTLPALERLGRFGYLPEATVSGLQKAYLYLRNVEHKLQIAAGFQTHSLPTNPREFGILAARLGYGKDDGSVACFTRDLSTVRDLVADQFRQMFRATDQSAYGVAEAAQAAWAHALVPREATPQLERLGFARPEDSARELEFLARGRSSAAGSQRHRLALERLGPRLLDELAQSANPDLALSNFASFIAAVSARSSFLALLEQHPATRRVLIRLFASSAYLSTLFILHPEMIDTLVRSDLARVRRTREELAAELRAMLDAADDFEERLNALRLFRHQEFLRIAIADLGGELNLAAVQAELTGLAEAALAAALEQAYDAVEKKTAIPAELKLCALAMGRLGACEMSYNSDLDLIFVYDLPDDPSGAGRIAAARIVQKLISVLESPTREGYAYKLDLRLRPSGNAGPLVATLEGFRAYHQMSSALWERQSLVRGRVVAGDVRLGEQIEQARRDFVFGRGLTREEVEEIWTMRLRIERELGRETPRTLNLKQGHGGLVDVDFLAQMMALRYGQLYPALRSRDTASLLRAIGEIGLMPAPQIGALIGDHSFLSNLESRLRIESDHAVSALPLASPALTPIARRAGFDGADPAGDLLADLRSRRRRVRELVAACFAREASTGRVADGGD